MALSESVEESLKEAEGALRNALASVSYTHLTLPTKA